MQNLAIEAGYGLPLAETSRQITSAIWRLAGYLPFRLLQVLPYRTAAMMCSQHIARVFKLQRADRASVCKAEWVQKCH
jgi:hypothetical protein